MAGSLRNPQRRRGSGRARGGGCPVDAATATGERDGPVAGLLPARRGPDLEPFGQRRRSAVVRVAIGRLLSRQAGLAAIVQSRKRITPPDQRSRR
ncbi:hypothetical protein [Rhodococcus sp. SGAir0479]|uniref:hypothetical protein n=1 Tax=Rhodococcus sp. SGAir0479 TaxID=2567884 RepID=UPI0010CD1470|nr:hypothetical protein [Rhodococcus sp. SGAir0479]QCQ94193.1 hypothetical protein E7742_23080 [Rhodococcus sp. SGAir0479]